MLDVNGLPDWPPADQIGVTARAAARLGLQLYTVRDAVAADLQGALRRVAEAGYAGVETMGTYGMAPGDLAAVLDTHGLEWIAAFTGLPDDASLDALAQAGCREIVLPFLEFDGFSGPAAITRAATRISEVAAVLAEHGLTVGYHNHHWEFAPIDGVPALQRLFAECDARVFAEVDVYWARVGGVDPASLVAALGERVRRVHVKDGPARDAAQPMVAVGEGALDIPVVLAAAKYSEWHVVELDECDTDMFEAVEASARYLLDLGMTRGRG